jgi:hypothetical protein
MIASNQIVVPDRLRPHIDEFQLGDYPDVVSFDSLPLLSLVGIGQPLGPYGDVDGWVSMQLLSLFL